MKHVPPFLRRLLKRVAGYTMSELMIAMAIAVIVGGVIFIAVQAGLTLFAKNLAINQVHGAARNAVDRMAFDVARSVDQPRLINVTPVPASGDITHLDLELSDARRYVGRCDALNQKVLDGKGAANLGDFFVVTVAGNWPSSGTVISWAVGDWRVYTDTTKLTSDPNAYSKITPTSQKYNAFIVNVPVNPAPFRMPAVSPLPTISPGGTTLTLDIEKLSGQGVNPLPGDVLSLSDPPLQDAIVTNVSASGVTPDAGYDALQVTVALGYTYGGATALDVTTNQLVILKRPILYAATEIGKLPDTGSDLVTLQNGIQYEAGFTNANGEPSRVKMSRRRRAALHAAQRQHGEGGIGTRADAQSLEFSVPTGSGKRRPPHRVEVPHRCERSEQQAILLSVGQAVGQRI